METEEKAEEKAEENNLEEQGIEKKPEEKKKPDNRYSKRVEELNTKFREEERAKFALLEENKRLREVATIKEEPDEDNYSDPDKYKADKEQWRAQEKEKIKHEARMEIQNEQRQQKQQEKSAKVATQYGEQRVLGNEKFDNWYASETAVGNILTQHREHAVSARDSILEAKNSAAIIDYFGKHPDKLQDIAFLDANDQSKAIWNLDKDLEGKPVKTKTTAPDPVRSEKGGAPRQVIPKGGGYNSSKETWKDYCRRKNGMT